MTFNLITKIRIFLSSFHEPFIDSLLTWYALIFENEIESDVFWQDLSFFKYEEDFWGWYWFLNIKNWRI